MLQTRIFSFGIFTDDAEINVLVASLIAGNVLDQDNGSVDVEFLTEGDVERLVTRAFDRRVEDTCTACQQQTVSFDERDRPLRPSLLRLSDAMASLNSSSACLSPVSIPDTSICSHSIGTLSALKIDLTASETSAPTPSPWNLCQTSYCSYHSAVVPGISVTVYFPPNLVGLKMSLVTVVAMARRVSISKLRQPRDNL